MEINTDQLEELDIPKSIQMHLNLSMDDLHETDLASPKSSSITKPTINNNTNHSNVTMNINPKLQNLKENDASDNSFQHRRSSSSSAYINTSTITTHRSSQLNKTPSFLVTHPNVTTTTATTTISDNISNAKNDVITTSNNNVLTQTYNDNVTALNSPIYKSNLKSHSHSHLQNNIDSSSSVESLNLLLEKQQLRQLNHPLHNDHLTSAQTLPNSVKNSLHCNSKYNNNFNQKYKSNPILMSNLNNQYHTHNLSVPNNAGHNNNQNLSNLNLRVTMSNTSTNSNSNPNVKETNRISLKYDPVSKKKVLNTYEIMGEIGRGQHGKVKLAKHILTNELVAIKIVNRDDKKKRKFFSFKSAFQKSNNKSNCTDNNKANNKTNNNSDDDKKFDKINREIAIMKKCHHKHVVKLIEVLDDLKSKKIYLVLEYCAKGEVKWCASDQLETEAKGPPLLSFQRTREIFRGVILGLEYLHYQGIIHRDIKPANLLLSADGDVKISDFGVSLAATKDANEDGKEALDELELAKTVGTPAFFAPEICLGDEAKLKYQMCKSETFNGTCISFMIDIWALGVTLYCLLFGMLPFISNFEMELFEKIVNDELIFPDFDVLSKNNVSAISNQNEYDMAKDLLLKLLTKNPMKRIQISNIKRHPFSNWDFDYIEDLTNINLINEKKTEQFLFQKNQSDELKQISISNREVRHAVGGVGKKIKDSIFKTLPLKYISSLNSDQSMASVETHIFETTSTTNESLVRRDPSILLSEGSASDSSEANSYRRGSTTSNTGHLCSASLLNDKNTALFYNNHSSSNNNNTNGGINTNNITSKLVMSPKNLQYQSLINNQNDSLNDLIEENHNTRLIDNQIINCNTFTNDNTPYDTLNPINNDNTNDTFYDTNEKKLQYTSNDPYRSTNINDSTNYDNSNNIGLYRKPAINANSTFNDNPQCDKSTFCADNNNKYPNYNQTNQYTYGNDASYSNNDFNDYNDGTGYSYNDPNDDLIGPNEPFTIVTLPINSSFASLDSFYIDNFAMTKLSQEPNMNSENITHSDPVLSKKKDRSLRSNKVPKSTSPVNVKPQKSNKSLANTRNSNQSVPRNRSKTSYSNLAFLNMGLSSTTNDRIPRNHQQPTKKVSRKRSSVDLTTAMSNFKISSVSQPNKSEHASSTNEVSPNPNSRIASSSPKSFPRETKNSQSSISPGSSAVSSGNTDNSSNFSGVSNPTCDIRNSDFRVKKGNFFVNFNGQDEESSSASSSSSANSTDTSDYSDSDASYSSSPLNSEINLDFESVPVQFSIESGNGSVLSLRDLPGLSQVQPFLDSHSRPLSRKRTSSTEDEYEELVLHAGSAGRNRRQEQVPKNKATSSALDTNGELKPKSHIFMPPFNCKNNTSSATITRCSTDQDSITKCSTERGSAAVESSNLQFYANKNDTLDAALNPQDDNNNSCSKSRPLRTYSNFGLVTMNNITSKPTTETSPVSNMAGKNTNIDSKDLNYKNLLRSALSRSTSEKQRDAKHNGKQCRRSNSTSVTDVTDVNRSKILDNISGEGSSSDESIDDVFTSNRKMRSQSVTVSSLTKNKK